MSLELVKHILQQHSITHFGFAPLERPISIDLYSEWLNDGFHADMKYLKEHKDQKENPQLLMNKAKSAIVVTVPYPQREEHFPLKALQVAKYAQSTDYHYWLKAMVKGIADDLVKLFPTESFLSFTDSSPVLERDLAYQAGLGWFGKNSCLISRMQGSYFLIAEIYTTMDLSTPIPVSPDHCGTCNRCIDACPTDAINDNRTIDANKCISYWTIEAKTTPPIDLAKNFSNWFFGCDICQDVCPWNGKVYNSTYKHPEVPREALIEELRWILEASNGELEKTFKTTPLLRSRGRGLKRNALVVIANSNLVELASTVDTYCNHPELKEIAHWCKTQLHTSLS